jgi:hypothetical protein
VIEDWYQMSFERQKRYVTLIVESVTMEEVSQHVLKLVLTYQPPIVCTLTGYVLREKCGLRAWTDEENQSIRTLYPLADRANILKAIPNRTCASIRQHAMEMGVTRSTWLDSSGIGVNRTCADTQLIESLQAEYPLFGKSVGAKKAHVAGVWQPFDSAVLKINNTQGLIHHQPCEYSLPGMKD